MTHLSAQMELIPCSSLPKLQPYSPAFLSLSFSEVSETVPVIIGCLRETVAKSASGLLVHLVSMVISWQAKEEPSAAVMKWTVPESVLVKLPKEWNYNPLEALRKEETAEGMQASGESFFLTTLLLSHIHKGMDNFCHPPFQLSLA